MNRLARERSPYLLQHANNPVDWYPWGEEAFARARAEDKPIFLSVGYSTCHWCHVMEHESFEDPAIAAVLNEHFIPVKVDREERPDVDRVYMTFVQGTTGSGGWPMSVWLTPELKPFYGGTYFPPSSKWNRPGFVDILRELQQVVVRQSRTDRAVGELGDRAAQVRSAGRAGRGPAVRRTSSRRSPRSSGARSISGTAASGARRSSRDRASCCFCCVNTCAPAMPMLARWCCSTLRAMAVGGMRDHVGGGFHRYSVDPAWRVPHFEKMLYDQAQLVLAYLEGAQASGDPFHIEVAEDTLRYVMREMTDDGGGFFSAEDADSIPPEQAGRPGCPQDGGRVLSLDRRRTRSAARRRRADRQAPLRRRG